jgi:AcrR family transcriptional regulator
MQRIKKRTYSRHTRDVQIQDTRTRILEALASQVSDPALGGFSIPQVAARASVSVRTVYHHFPSREVMLDALQQWGEAQIGRDSAAFPTRLEDLAAVVQEVFAKFDDRETLIRAQLVTAPGRELRAHDRQRRGQLLASMVRTINGLDPVRRREAAAVLHYLISSEAWRSLKDESGMTGAEAGHAVAWAVEALVAALKRQARTTRYRRPPARA